jgi:hypothetical protein
MIIHVVMGSICGTLVVLIGLAVWYDVAKEPARKTAWTANCMEHNLSQKACQFLYAEKKRNDGAISATMSFINSSVAVSRSYGH